MLWDTDVFSEMERLRGEMNSLFSNYSSHTGGTTFPLLNVYDRKDDVVVSAELPGMTRENVHITFADNVLTLSGTKEPSPAIKGMEPVRRERAEGPFEKSLRVPVKIATEGISASFTNGILQVTLPKAEEAKPKSITIEAK